MDRLRLRRAQCASAIGVRTIVLFLIISRFPYITPFVIQIFHLTVCNAGQCNRSSNRNRGCLLSLERLTNYGPNRDRI